MTTIYTTVVLREDFLDLSVKRATEDISPERRVPHLARNSGLDPES
ncbi:hypothetical protein AB0D80_38350 [Streptomyces tendae]